MPTLRPTLLLTRPEPGLRRFAAEFRGRFGADWPIILSPLMRTEWLTPPLSLADAREVIFTSETAVKAFARACADRGLRAWCVGQRTAAAARAAGFEAIAGPGDARGLAALIASRLGPARMVWPHGKDVAADISELLKPAGIETVSAVLYNQAAAPLTPEARQALEAREPLLVPLFSARSARLLADAAPDRAAPLSVAALSPAVAAVAARLAPARVQIADRPDSDGMLDALARLTQQQAGS